CVQPNTVLLSILSTVSLLPPVNFTIEVTGLAQVLLRWEPNPEQEPRLANLEYHVKINAPQPDDYETGITQSTFAVPLHQGLSASVQTILQGGPFPLASSWVSAELPAPPGSPGTSVTNLTCITNTVAGPTHRRPYQVSLRCSWRAGAAAPGDTQYSLYYRYGPWTEECREYSTDETRRNTACWFPRTSISSKGHDWLAVRVNGSSRRAAIRPLDRLFAVQAIGSEERKPLMEWVLILLTVAICVALLTCSLLCSTCHLWARLFPPVPAPKSNIKDLLVTAHCEVILTVLELRHGGPGWSPWGGSRGLRFLCSKAGFPPRPGQEMVAWLVLWLVLVGHVHSCLTEAPIQ
uniref:Interleukin 5 receptor subunit alpha n=1 Tax=Sciurus vulgaris TaxID=55149 RepID=A0A8D2E1K8_SCIVU